jgi:hypothetical protein
MPSRLHHCSKHLEALASSKQTMVFINWHPVAAFGPMVALQLKASTRMAVPLPGLN